MLETPKNGSPKAAPKRFCGVRGKSGPAKGNANALRHGLKAGKLPADAKYIEVRLNILRRNLEAAVVEVRREVSLTDAAAIQTAIRWERHACLAQRWLTKQYSELKPEQRLTFSREIAKASAERDKAVAALRLDRDAKDSIIDALYSRLPKAIAGNADGAGGTEK